MFSIQNYGNANYQLRKNAVNFNANTKSIGNGVQKAVSELGGKKPYVKPTTSKINIFAKDDLCSKYDDDAFYERMKSNTAREAYYSLHPDEYEPAQAIYH